jgi:hypothetical protein
MKKIALILTTLILICNSTNLIAQNLRELTFYSSCNSAGLKSSTPSYNLGYKYLPVSHTLVISGNIGYENCGIRHIFNAVVDSNKVMLSESIIDTMLATCSCAKKIKMEIDSFYYDQFTVEFEGEYLTDILWVKNQINSNIYPNPTKGIVNLDLPNGINSSEIDLIDCYGRIIETKIINGQSSINFDLSNYKTGLYLIRIRDLNLTRVVIKN